MYVIQLLDIVRVKGKHEPVKIYEVIASGHISQEKKLELDEYDKAHTLYMEAEFKKAKMIFLELFAKYEKHLYNLYAQRCDQLLDSNLENFDGVFEFTSK